jgi:hypothetical protein
MGDEAVIKPRFLHCVSRRVREDANAKKRRRLTPVGMTLAFLFAPHGATRAVLRRSRRALHLVNEDGHGRAVPYGRWRILHLGEIAKEDQQPSYRAALELLS